MGECPSEQRTRHMEPLDLGHELPSFTVTCWLELLEELSSPASCSCRGLVFALPPARRGGRVEGGG